MVGEKIPSVFDWKRYIKDHPDLQRTFGKGGPVHVNDATCHYLSHGIKESRKKYILGTNEPYVYDFDWKMYDKLNPDVFTQRHRNVGEWHCFRHWCEYGYKEGRKTIIVKLVMKNDASISSDENVNKRWRNDLNNILQLQRFNSIEELVKHVSNLVNIPTYSPLVVMPTYNRAANIDNLIQMMLNQTFQTWTFLIIDDGSTVENKTIFKSVQDKYKENKNIIFLENDTNKHIGFTLNRGIQYFLDNKSLTHLTWVSDDNIYYSTFLEKLYMSNKDLTYSWFDLLHITENNKVGNNKIHKPYFHGFEQLLDGYPGCASFMWSRNAINKVGFYNENIPGCEDYEYMMRTIKYIAEDKRMQINCSLMQYVRHPESEFDKRFKEIKDIERKIVKIYKTLNVNNQTSAFIYYSKTKYDVLFQRPHQIMRFYDKSVIKCFIGLVDDVLYEEKYNLLVIPYHLRECAYNALSNHNITTYYTDSRLYNEVIQRPGKKLYDLIDAPIEEFTVWKPNLEKCVKNSDCVMYSHPDLIKFLNEIDADKKYHYISNACDYEHFSKAKERIGERPVDFPSTDKPILGYYGAFAQWLDFDIIRKHADEGVYHIVMIGGIVNSPSYNLRFDHPNITWLSHTSYDELPYYLSWFDKCFLPFKDCELTTYVNPCKLWEYMACEKEIIKYNVNMNADKIVTYDDVCLNMLDIIKIVKLSVIILCFNQLEYTKQCIESVFQNTCCNSYEVIVVSNGSTDGTIEYLESLRCKHANIKIINNTENLGFSKGMNIGAKNANGKYIILLNNDTIVGEGWDFELIKTLESDDNIFAVTPITNCCGNEAMVDMKFDNHNDFFNKVNKFNSNLKDYIEVYSLGLFCGIFRTNEFKKINYLDENYNNGWEDDDLYDSISLLNKSVVISTKSLVYHIGSVTVGKNNYNQLNNPNRLYYENKWNKTWNTKSGNYLISENKKYNIPDYIEFENIYFHKKIIKDYSSQFYFIINNNLSGGSFLWQKNLERIIPLVRVLTYDNFNEILQNHRDTSNIVILINSFIHTDFTIENITFLYNKYKFKIILPIHEWYWFCSNENISTYNLKYHSIYLDESIYLNKEIIDFFGICAKIICPSKFVYDIFYKHYPNEKLKLCYWLDYDLELPKKCSKLHILNKINIGVLTALDEYKGKEQVFSIMEHLKQNDPNINILISGINIEKYDDNFYSFINLIKKYNIHALMYLNKWGETWSYSVTKGLKSNLPIFYNNIGSYKDRISKQVDKYIINNNDESEYNLNIVDKFNNFISYIKNNDIYINDDINHKPFIETSLIENITNEINKKNKNVVIITSKIVTSNTELSYVKNRSIYTSETRYNDSLETIDSVLKYIPNCVIIFVDNSELDINMKTGIKNKAHYFLDREYINSIKNIDYFTNISLCKGTGEMSQLTLALKFIKNSMLDITCSNIFKITGRYTITDKFNIDEFQNNHIMFKINEILFEKKICDDYYYTCFYKIPFLFIESMIRISYLFNVPKGNSLILDSSSFGLEQYLPNLIKKNLDEDKSLESIKFQTVNYLGIKQNISVTNDYTDIHSTEYI